MGDIKRKKAKFRRPKKPYNKQRIEEEKKITEKYGLKNKKEIWKAESRISKIRRAAKGLIAKSEEEKQEFLNRLNKRGLNAKNIPEALALSREDLLERRLQTILVKKNLAKSSREARQFIVHKQVIVDGSVINIPSFNVDINLENKISLKKRDKKTNNNTETEKTGDKSPGNKNRKTENKTEKNKEGGQNG